MIKITTNEQKVNNKIQSLSTTFYLIKVSFSIDSKECIV